MITFDEVFRDKSIEKRYVVSIEESSAYLRLSLDLLDEMENVQFKDCGFIEDDTKVIMEREQFMKIKELLIWLIENLNIRKYPSVMTTAYIENIKKAIQDLIFKTNSIS
jgi:hypothetical protein